MLSYEGFVIALSSHGAIDRTGHSGRHRYAGDVDDRSRSNVHTESSVGNTSV